MQVLEQMLGRLATFGLLSILAALMAGCQSSGVGSPERSHSCVVTPADLVECELNDDSETAGEA